MPTLLCRIVRRCQMRISSRAFPAPSPRSFAFRPERLRPQQLRNNSSAFVPTCRRPCSLYVQAPRQFVGLKHKNTSTALLLSAMGGRHHPAQQRQHHAKRRLAKLRAICPDIPEDVLSRVPLRQLSFAVRRTGRAQQTSLKDERKVRKCDNDGAHGQNVAEARSTTDKSGQAPFQNCYHQPIASVTTEQPRCVPKTHG